MALMALAMAEACESHDGPAAADSIYKNLVKVCGISGVSGLGFRFLGFSVFRV